MRPAPLLHRVLAVLVVLGAALGLPLRADAAGGPPVVTYHPPVDAPISDPFRPPAHRFGPGNRGIEYATATGTPVRAVAAGEVTFAGQVGGTLHVTVLHADGLRSTVSYLERIDVMRGHVVELGEPLGLAGSRTHLGVRSGDEYLDPASLFQPIAGSVRLVPTAPAAATSVAAERAAIAAWLAGHRSLFERNTDWLRDRAVGAAELAAGLSGALDPTAFVIGTGVDLFERLTDAAPCTPAAHDPSRPTTRRVVVLVGGLGSSATRAAVDDVDTVGLGYDTRDVYRFSYAGGRVHDPGDRHQGLPASGYGPSDSQIDLLTSAERLRELLTELSRLDPDVPIDVVAHSQGGLVARLAIGGLAGSQATGVDGSVRVGAVVTIGTPHQGADLASAAAAIRSDGAASALFAGFDRVLGTEIDLESPAMRQLMVGSDLTRALASTGMPDGVRLTSISARGDLVVPASRTGVEGASNITTPLTGIRAHDVLPADPATTREIALALSGSPATCESAGDVAADVFGGRVVQQAEQLIGAGLFVAGAAVPG